MTDNNQAWDRIYGLGQSSHYPNEGDIGIFYRLPKFARMFKKYIRTLEGLRVLEIGGGIGEMYENLSKEFSNDTFSYTITEYSRSATEPFKHRLGGHIIVSVINYFIGVGVTTAVIKFIVDNNIIATGCSTAVTLLLGYTMLNRFVYKTYKTPQE